MASASTSSTTVREEGNQMLERANDIWVAASVRSPRYQKAVALYERAISLAKTSDEFCSAHKNLVIARFRWIRLMMEEPKMSPSVASPFEYIQSSLRLFLLAIERSFDAKDDAWRDGFTKVTDEHLHVIIFEWEVIKSLPNAEKLPIYEKIISGLGIPTGRSARFRTAALVHAKIARMYFLQAVSKADRAQGTNFPVEKVNDLQRILSSAQHAINKAMSFAPRGDILVSDELHEVCSDVEQMQHRVSSYGDHFTAEDLLQRALCQSDELNMELVWGSIDFFRGAITKTSNYDIELEAICNARIGYIYSKILKEFERGHRFSLHAIQLAETLKPRNFHGDVWYSDAQKNIEEHRQKIIVREEQEKSEEKLTTKARLKTVLDVINQQRDDTAFIRFIYKTHPPRGKSPTTPPEVLNSSNMKTVLREAIVNYHPDKQTDKSLDWEVTSLEIAKQLNIHYEKYKMQN